MGSGVFSGVWPTANIVAVEFIIYHFTIRYVTWSAPVTWPGYSNSHSPIPLTLCKPLLTIIETSIQNLAVTHSHYFTAMRKCIAPKKCFFFFKELSRLVLHSYTSLQLTHSIQQRVACFVFKYTPWHFVTLIEIFSSEVRGFSAA